MVTLNPLSRDWLLVKRQISEWVEAEKHKLVTAKDWDAIKESQGKIAGWLSILNLEGSTDAQE